MPHSPSEKTQETGLTRAQNQAAPCNTALADGGIACQAFQMRNLLPPPSLGRALRTPISVADASTISG